MKRALLAALAIFIAGCFSTGTRESQRYYVLEVPAGKQSAAKSTRTSTLLVAPTTIASFYDTQDIVYSRSPGTRAYYQFNSWTERPSRTIHVLLVERLERSGAFRNVAEARSGVEGDLVLSTHIQEMYHDAVAAPGSAQVTLSAELARAGRAAPIARRTFNSSAQAASYDAQGAVKAFSEALGPLLDDLAAWVDDSAPRP